MGVSGGSWAAPPAAPRLASVAAVDSTPAVGPAKQAPFVLAAEPLDPSSLERGDHVLVVWATWAPGAEGLAPRIERLSAIFSEHAQVSSVVFQDDSQAVSRFLATELATAGDMAAGEAPTSDSAGTAAEVRRPGSRIPVYLDTSGALCRRFGVRALPQLLILREGEAVFRGPLPVDPDRVISRQLGIDLDLFAVGARSEPAEGGTASGAASLEGLGSTATPVAERNQPD
ncbi:MAG: hypothetical protein MI919_06045 [Holophagales bacterium]|nr:hypothetical protein [Holophagales bacterium]